MREPDDNRTDAEKELMAAFVRNVKRLNDIAEAAEAYIRAYDDPQVIATFSERERLRRAVMVDKV